MEFRCAEVPGLDCWRCGLYNRGRALEPLRCATGVDDHMPLDSEKKRLEARLLNVLSQALQERNRDDIVGTSLELGALYLSGDLYEKAEECYRRVLESPVVDLARAEERAGAETGLAEVALRRGHLTLASEALARAEKILDMHGRPAHGARLLVCRRDLHAARYRDVVDTIEATMAQGRGDSLGDARVDFMILEGRARYLMGRNRQASRLLEKALELAQSTGYETGAASAHGELGALESSVGGFKNAHEHLTESLRSNEGVGSQWRLDQDRCHMGLLLLRMGRWSEADELLQRAYESSRDLRSLENRLCSQLRHAELQALRGQLDDAHDQALDAMEVARAAGFVRHHVEGLLLLGRVGREQGKHDAALEALHEAEALYGRIAPESALMVQVHSEIGQILDRAGESNQAFERLMRAHNLARETGNDYERHRIDSVLGLHFRRKGDSEKAANVISRAAAELGSLGAKYDVGQARLWYSELLVELAIRTGGEAKQKSLKLARSNIFEARRLLEPLGAARRLEECAAVESHLQPETPANSSD